MEGDKDKDLYANAAGNGNEKAADSIIDEKSQEKEINEHNPESEISPESQSKNVKDTLNLENLISNLKSLSAEDKKDPDIVAFSPDAKMEWGPWLQYFESICVETNRSDYWKIRTIHKFLRDKALTLYINNCLHILHWSELTALFDEAFSLPGEASLSDFSEIKFKIGDEVNEYYQKKMKMGRELGLEQKFILDGLTEGLPFELKKLVITNAPKTPTEWRELVFKLNKLQSPNKNNVTKNQTEPNFPNYQFRQWRPQRPPQENFQNQQTRPWGYRVPFQSPQNRPYTPNNERNPQRQIRPQNNQSSQNKNNAKPNVHYNESFPPSPCWVCLNIGISNAYHWVRNCPFRNQTLDPNQFRNFSTENTSGTHDNNLVSDSDDNAASNV